MDVKRLSDDALLVQYAGGNPEAKRELSDRLPAWRKRPTKPGLWVYLPTSHLPDSPGLTHPGAMYLTQDDLDRGAPFYADAVYGPIPSFGGNLP